ncbi:hypothetical protein AAF712_011563 [Marasmius tenuissimus]|uniref:DNA 3'-5' helicase n=1 Tax=Marasmius tenuissimus TaxID=585030 RepID=A0ABR2ZK68_9AGAR
MTQRLKWTDEEGKSAISLVVSRCIPQWPHGLREYQEKYIPAIMNGDNLLVITATGDGKSAFFCVPIVVHNEISRHPDLYPALPRKEHAMGVIVTPTKGLAASIVRDYSFIFSKALMGLSVLELRIFNIAAFAYTHEAITEARIAGIDIVMKICESRTWQVICVDPEHLQQPEWRQIMKHDDFTKNLVYFCCEEIHLIRDWGLAFRPCFKFIGSTACGELPHHVPIIGLSATCPPGLSTDVVCRSLGLVGNNFHTVRRSNERLNMQLILEPIARVRGASKYHQLYPYVKSNRKIVIHVNTIPEAYEIYLFLFNLLPDGCNRLRRIRMYHSLCTDQYNHDTLELMDDDPYLQVIIATIGFANGINRLAIQDCVSWRLPMTLDLLIQQLGRGGRSADIICRGIALAPVDDIKRARAMTTGHDVGAAAGKSKRSKKKKDVPTLDDGKAQLLAEEVCLTGACNRYYQNPPVESSLLSCHEANRAVYCSLCAARHDITYDFPSPPLPDEPDSPPDWLPLPAPQKKKSRYKSKTNLGKKERTSMQTWLHDFRRLIWSQANVAENPALVFYPVDFFLSQPVIELILDEFLVIPNSAHLATILRSNPWQLTEDHTDRLFSLIQEFQATIRGWRRDEKRERAEAKKVKSQSAGNIVEGLDLGSSSESDGDVEADIGEEPEYIYKSQHPRHFTPSDSTKTETSASAFGGTGDRKFWAKENQQPS